MIADVLLVVIGLLGAGIATIVDIRTREVPNIVSYTMIAAGLLIRLVHAALNNELGYLLAGVIGGLLMGIAGMTLYLTRQWGGGDTKLLIALGVLFGTTPSFIETTSFSFPFLAVMLINIGIVGALYGIMVSIYLAIRSGQAYKEEVVRLSKDRRTKITKVVALLCAVVILGTAFLYKSTNQQWMALSTLALFVLVYPYLSVMIHAVERSAMVRKKKPSELVEGDWVEQDVYSGKEVVYKRKPLGIEKEDIAKLVRARIKEVVVKEGIPFIPPFFIGLVITMITGQILFLPT